MKLSSPSPHRHDLHPALAPAALAIAAFSLLLAPLSQAGAPAPLKAAEPPNPLAFADGRIIIGLENQSRFEYRENNFDFNNGLDSLTDDAWLLTRSRISLQLKPADWLTIYAQGQDIREVDSDRADIPGQLGAEGDNPFDLRQAWIELGDGKAFPLALKIGRQILNYGDQRLIGPLEWNYLSRTFDAARLRWTGGDGLWVDAFVSSVVVPDRDGFDESDWDSVFSGIYAHIPTFGIQDTEVYALHLDDSDRDDHFVTLGARLKSLPDKLGPWDYEAELAAQAGTAEGKDLAAFAADVETGYTFPGAWKPRIGLEYVYGSGDGDAADADIGSFQNLYPTNHMHYGHMDVFSWRNMHDAILHLSVKPREKITATLDCHSYWLDDTADTWRRANARTAVRPASPAASNYAGSELDFFVSYAHNTHFNIAFGWARFFAGSYLDDTGAGSDADFIYVMTSIKL